MNRFLYAEGNPWSMVDPSGHASFYEGEDCGPGGKYCGSHGNDQNAHTNAIVVANTGNPHDNDKPYPGPQGTPQGTPPGTSGPCPGPNCGSAPIPTTEAPLPQGCSTEALNCTIHDINLMTMSQRSAWLRALAVLTGGGDWLNALIAVVDAAGLTGHEVGGWFGAVDAEVLFNAQAGYLAFRRGEASSTNGAVQAWSNAWRAILGSQASDDDINIAIAYAEDASIAEGRQDAVTAHLAATKGEETGLLTTNAFRALQTNHGALDPVKGACRSFALCALVDQTAEHSFGIGLNAESFDERDYGLAFVGAATSLDTDGIHAYPGIGNYEEFFPPR